MNIRYDEKSLNYIRQYVLSNPALWEQDTFYQEYICWCTRVNGVDPYRNFDKFITL
jgi:hypothetical protein